MPNPNPIPPELPTDPSRIPPTDFPINTPPEKGPGRPEPLPPNPVPPVRVSMAALMAIMLLAGSAVAQKPAGKDTSELEPPNPAQTECSKIADSDARRSCLQRNQPSGAPATGKTTGDAPAAVAPSVGREMKPAPADKAPEPTNPNAPALSR
jgi:hypothetical protein